MLELRVGCDGMTTKKSMDEISCIERMEKRECRYWDLHERPSNIKRRGSIGIQFKHPTWVQRIVIYGDLNLNSVQLHPYLPKNGPFFVGTNIRNKKGWDSGRYEPVLAVGISLVGRRKQKGRRSHPSKVKEIVILKETKCRK